MKGDGAGGSDWPELDGVSDVDTTLRIARQVQRDFDRITVARADDEALIARAVDSVLVGRAPVVRARFGGRVAAVVGLGVALFASGAAAWWAVRSAREPGHEPLPAALARRPHAGAGSHATAPIVAPAPVAPMPVEEPAPIPPPAPTAARPPALRTNPPFVNAPPGPKPARAPAAAASLAPVTTAADLFRRAGDARRAGDVGRACALYRELEDRFPGSAAARLARVSFGRLLLGTGDVRAAEAQFALYLAGGDGPLVQEALVGRAESLRRLARPDDERRVWQKLLEAFPGGVYTLQARDRLSELGVPARMPQP